MKNQSGFYGYSLASVYPDMGDGVTQTLASVPDAEEQSALSAQEPEKQIATPVNGKTKSQTWIVFAALALLVVVFGIPGKAA